MSVELGAPGSGFMEATALVHGTMAQPACSLRPWAAARVHQFAESEGQDWRIS